MFLTKIKRLRRTATFTPEWDLRFLGLAKEISTWSKDPSTKVGAVLVDDNKIVVGKGYNGFPRGVQDYKERYDDRELKYKLVVHAEVNAILQAGDKSHNCTMYIYPSFALPPICNECCKIAIQAGVKEIVGTKPDMNDPRVQRWQESIGISKMMCDETGIIYRGI